MDDEREPTEDELREAEALARSLEGEDAGGAPADALQTAALLEASRHGELSELRQRAVQRRVLDEQAQDPEDEAAPMDAALDEPAPAHPWLRWVAPAATLAAAATLMLIFVPADRPEATNLPGPGPGLLKAQAAAARGTAADAAMLQVGMRRYRARYLAALEQRYEGRQ